MLVLEQAVQYSLEFSNQSSFAFLSLNQVPIQLTAVKMI